MAVVLVGLEVDHLHLEQDLVPVGLEVVKLELVQVQLVQVLEGLHLALVQQQLVVLQVEVDLAVAQVVQHQQGVAVPSLQLHRQLAMTVEPLLFLHLVKRLVPLILEAPQLGMV